MRLTLRLGILAGVLVAVILAQDKDPKRAQSSASGNYAALAGITRVTLVVELSDKGTPLEITEGEIMELASRRISGANIRLLKPGSRKSPDLVLLISVRNPPLNCVPPTVHKYSDIVIGGYCVGGPSVGIELKKRSAKDADGDSGLKTAWGMGLLESIDYRKRDLPPEIRPQLEQVLTQFITDYRAANPRAR